MIGFGALFCATGRQKGLYPNDPPQVTDIGSRQPVQIDRHGLVQNPLGGATDAIRPPVA
jgi:hypothetical protein